MRFDYLGIFGSLIGSEKKVKQKKQRTECPNCDHKQNIPFRFCPNCGQNARESKITFFSLIGEVFSSVFNLDASLYRSFFWLPIPAYLSKRYVQGERKQFLNPVRFFFFSMLLFFALIVGFMDLDFFSETNKDQLVKIERSNLLKKFESELDREHYSSFNAEGIDSMRVALFKGVKLPEKDTILNGKIDNDTLGILNLDLGIKILRRDLHTKPIDEILKDHQDKNWFNRLVIGQMIRVTRDFKGAITFFAGNGIWVFVAGIFFLSFIMKFMYIRKKRYMIEHSILLFHTHAFAFVVGIIVMLISKFVDEPLPIIGAGALISLLYVIISIKKYYGQGWVKTMIKFILITIFYFIIMVALIGIVLLISLLFFN